MPETPRPPPARGRRLLFRVAFGLAGILALFALLWLAAQVALNSALLSRVINRRPERLFVEWSSASMPIPGQVTLEDLRLRGRSRRMDWYLELDRVFLRVDLRRLVDRTFEASGIRGRGARFYLRRRLADTDDEELVPFMPPIPGLEPEPVGERPPGVRPPGWRIELEDLELADFEEIWIDDLHALGTGSVTGGVSIQVRGPFALKHLDLTWQQGELSFRGQPMAHGLELDLGFELEPVITRSLKLHDLLRALDARIDLEAAVPRLSFLDPYLRHAAGLHFDGEGRLEVSGGISGGVLTPSSRLQFDGDRLAVRLPQISIAGSGALSLIASPPAENGPRAGTELRAQLQGVEVDSPYGLRAVSDEVVVEVRTTDADLLAGFPDPTVFLDLPALELPDLHAFDGLLPAGLPVHILGGKARVSTRLDLTRTEGDARLIVVSPDLTLQLGEKPLRSEIELDVRYRGGLIPNSFDVGGSRLHVKAASSPPLAVELVIGEAAVETGGSPTATNGLSATAFRLAEGTVHVEGRLSDLAPLNDHFNYGRWLQLGGPVSLDSRLIASEGRLRAGSRVDMHAEKLVARLSDWSVSGEARVTSEVLSDGGGVLGIAFDEVDLARRGLTHIRGSSFRLEATAPNRLRGSGVGDVKVRLELPGAQIFDLAPLNDYLPSSGLVRLNDGTAVVDGSAELSAESGQAELILEGRAIDVELLGEPLRTNLRLETRMSSDEPASRRFSIGGSSLRIDDTRWLDAAGEESLPWSGELDLVEGSVVVAQPLAVEAGLQLRLQDTRPLFLLITRHLPAASWFERWLVFDGVEGAGRLELQPDQISLTDLDVRGGGGHLTGSFSLATSGNGTSVLHRLSDLDLRAELDETDAIELASLNRLLPEHGVIRFGAGEGRLAGSIHLEETSGAGSVQLVGKGLEARLHDQTLDTDLRFDFELSSDDLPSRRFRVDGSRLALEHTRWLADDRTEAQPGWWGNIEIMSGEVELGQPLVADASVRVRLRDNWPLLYLMAERSRVVRWFQGLLEISDIEGTARIKLDRKALRVEGVRITGQRLLAEALLDFAAESEYGLFYVRFRGLAAAVELENGKRNFKVISPRKWYESRLAERQAASS